MSHIDNDVRSQIYINGYFFIDTIEPTNLTKSIKKKANKLIVTNEWHEELIIRQILKSQASNKSKGASSSSNEKVYQISQSLLRKKANKQIITSQSPKLQLSKKSKDTSSSSKEKESPLKKNVKKQSVISKNSTSIQEVKRCIYIIKCDLFNLIESIKEKDG